MVKDGRRNIEIWFSFRRFNHFPKGNLESGWCMQWSKYAAFVLKGKGSVAQ